MDRLGRATATCTVNSISIRNSKDGIKCTEAKELTLRSLLKELPRLTVLNTVKQASLFNRDLRVIKAMLLIEKST